MCRKRNHASGFTLIELMLSMTFISVMLIAIAMLIIQMSNIYTRGETFRQVNQAVRLLVVDMQRTFAAADPVTVNISKQGSYHRICTGKFSYIWQAARFPVANNKYSNGEQLRLVRISDPAGRYCRDTSSVTPHESTQINKATDSPVELLQDGDRSLKIYSLQVQEMASTVRTKQKMYRITILLGTDNTGAIDASNTACVPPSDLLVGEENYCAINRFSFTVRVGVG